MLTGVGATFTYNGANRVESAAEVSGGTEYFGYSPDNKLVYRNTAAGVEEITFYGAYGEKLWNSSTGSYIWFAGRLIADGNSAVFQDRVGTNRFAVGGFIIQPNQVTEIGPVEYEGNTLSNYDRDYGSTTSSLNSVTWMAELHPGAGPWAEHNERLDGHAYIWRFR